MKRWLRAAIPFAALTALITGTLIVHAIEQPDDDDPDYLTPQQVHGISGGTLAERLRARGITVDRVTSTEAALDTIADDPVTVFVATPDLADLPRLRTLPTGSHVVAVNPSASALLRSGWPAEVSRTYWNTTVADPICGDRIAVDAGPAAVRQTEYVVTRGGVCYNGAVATFPVSGHTVTVVGSPDPFRDDRIAEHGNAALAVGLLAQHDRVVWIDVHERDRPSPTPATTPPTPPGAEPTWTPTPGGTDPWTDYDNPGDGGQGRPGGNGNGDGQGDGGPGDSDQQSGGLPDDPLVRDLPPALVTTLILLALILLALAFAAARRLGTPVAEPLPSKVPANETMLGHARLYQRARAREASLDILRAHARRRLTTHLGLPPHADSEQIAAHAGLPVRYVREILDGDAPDSNADLVEAATLLQRLVRDVTTPQPVEGEQS
jgi:hypothetical protein